jgi:MerR family copper efflux transcriptional regulator
MFIRELAQRTGLSPHTIRFYEKRGLIAKRFIQRGENNYRRFVEEAVENLRAVRTLQEAGFTLAEIKDLMGRWYSGKLTAPDGLAILGRKIQIIEERMAELTRIKTALREFGDHLKQATEQRRA